MVSFRAGLIARSAMADTTPPNTLRALPGIFRLTGEDMTVVVGYEMQAGMGAFALIDPGTTKLTPPVPLTTTWSTTDHSSLVTISGGNLTAIMTGAYDGFVHVARSIASHSTGKYFFSATVTSFVSSLNMGVYGTGLNVDGYPTSDTNSVSLQTNGNIFNNGGGIGATDATTATGDVQDCCIDLTAKLAWFRVNGGNWNGSGTANPATGVGGLSVAFTTGSWCAAVGMAHPSTGYTANFGPTYTYAKPSGFLDW